ncbi:MAG: hypothetical protein WBM12_21665, partial [Pseudolabrys sp.]
MPTFACRSTAIKRPNKCPVPDISRALDPSLIADELRNQLFDLHRQAGIYAGKGLQVHLILKYERVAKIMKVATINAAIKTIVRCSALVPV